MQGILLGAVAYDPKVVTIWEGMREYFRQEAQIDVEVALFLNYEAQVRALLSSKIDIAWNTNLAFVQAEHQSEGRCQPLGMRDTDLGWKSVLVTLKGGPVKSLSDLKGKRLALGSADSGHAAILPVHFLAQAGLVENVDYTSVRFNLDVGKHGDTGTSEVDVLKAVLDGKADAGFVGSPFWAGVREKGLVPTAALAEVWSSPDYTHCMFTARADLPNEMRDTFTRALFAMSFENPKHRPILEAEGLKQWIAPVDGYASLRAAVKAQSLL